jgi:hypothetical protein
LLQFMTDPGQRRRQPTRVAKGLIADEEGICLQGRTTDAIAIVAGVALGYSLPKI